MAIGTVGVLFIVKPAFLDRNIIYLVALLGTGFNGLAFVLNKYLQRPDDDCELTTMFFVNLVAVICNLPVLATATLPRASGLAVALRRDDIRTGTPAKHRLAGMG